MLFIERYFYIYVGVDQATEGTNTKWNFHLYASAVFGTSWTETTNGKCAILSTVS